jgi:uncharacterized protein YfdQ (DUF2303 family)
MPLMNSGSRDEPQQIQYSPSGIADAANLGREAERSRGVPFEDVQSGLIARVLDRDERVEVVDLEHTLGAPHHAHGEASIYDPTDFVSYVTRLAGKGTTLWADPDHHKITAIYDDHAAEDAPGWRRHRAVLCLRTDEEWSAWCDKDGKLGPQEWFAEFIEDHAASVVTPDAATMLEIATTFQAVRNASFERGTRLQSGDVQLRWAETTTASAGAKGHLEIPERFTVKLAPYLGVTPVELPARLRWRIRDGHLAIGYKLHRPDLAIREAFDRIRAQVAQNVKVPIHLGAAPLNLHPKRLNAF